MHIHKDEGGHPKQPHEEVIKLQMGLHRKHYQNNSIYSAAEYACPVWARSPHAYKLDPELNDECRSITGCLRPTNVEELYLLAGIAPPDIRRDVCARVEKKKQETNAAHSLHGHITVERRLKRECFLSSVRHADFTAKVIRCSEW